MTNLFHNQSGSPAPLSAEKRAFTGMPLTSRQLNGSNNQVSQKIKNFFRITSLGNSESKDRQKQHGNGHHGSHDGGLFVDVGTSTPRSETKSGFRQSRFLPHIGRSRSTTVASEGNPLEESLSPTANANPYFQHQGPPAIRHHNDGSVPPSPPETPRMPKAKLSSLVSGLVSNSSGGTSGAADDQATIATKEELARKLRRVASAPNAQGLFASAKQKDRPSTAELGKQPILLHANNGSTLGMVESGDLGNGSTSSLHGVDLTLPVPTVEGIPKPGEIRNQLAFRRTYSSNSIKVRSVEVGPGSFDKIKLIGKGDVGKVYLVREKKSNRLYAMKGELLFLLRHFEEAS